MTYNCKNFCGQDAEIICSRCAIKEAKNSQLLIELKRRIKSKEIRFNYDSFDNTIGGLWVCHATDEYYLDFVELEEYLEKKFKENDPK